MNILKKIRSLFKKDDYCPLTMEYFNDKYREVNDHVEYRYNQIRWFMLSLHNHLDIATQDILISQNFVKKHYIALETEHKVALESNDHLFPFGTKNDNTRYPRFVKKCETLFDFDRELKFLDLGCSGGGMVLDACLRGHIGIGLEGSNYSLINQRAEWRVIPNNLFTYDISKDFRLYDIRNNESVEFDIITAWEVLEHLTEKELNILLKTIYNHLSPDGYFICSISLVDSFSPGSYINLHHTVKPKEWWKEFFEKKSFVIIDNLFDINDFTRGSGNNSVCWGEFVESEILNSVCFVLKKG